MKITPRGTPSKPARYVEDIDRVAQAVDEALVMTVDKADKDESVDLDNILLSLAEARAYVVKAQLSAVVVDTILIEVRNDRDRMFADEVPGLPRPLPPLQPGPKQRAGIANKLKRHLDFDCPACGAKAGTQCFKMDRIGANARPTEERHPVEKKVFHTPRQALTRAANERIRREYDRNHS